MEWTAIATAITLIAIFISALVGIRQLNILEKRHRFDTGPFVTFDIEASTDTMPPEEEAEHHIIEIPELDEWANAYPAAPNRYVILRLTNTQNHLAGAATEVCFRIVFGFSKLGTPDTRITIPHSVTREIWLYPKELYRIVFANLKGLQAGVIDIDNIEYFDIDGNRYKRFYGYCHWALDNTGREWGGFRTSK